MSKKTLRHWFYKYSRQPNVLSEKERAEAANAIMLAIRDSYILGKTTCKSGDCLAWLDNPQQVAKAVLSALLQRFELLRRP